MEVKDNKSPLSWIPRILEWLYSLVLVIVGILGVASGISESAGLHLTGSYSWSLTLGIVGLLALALGLERFTRFARLEHHMARFGTHFDDLRADIHARLSVGLAEGFEDVYEKASQLVRKSEYSIRTIIFANQPIASEEFIAAVVERLQSHKAVTYDVILALDLSNTPKDVWERIEKRTADFRGAGIGGRTHLSILNTSKPIGFDVLIVDDQDCEISFSSAPNSPGERREFSIHFENQPRLAKRIRAWMDSISYSRLGPDEAKKEWAKAHKPKPPI